MKNETEPSLSGMTVNERLFVKGLLREFDLAAEKGDVTEVRRILDEIDLDDKSIQDIIERIL